MKSSIRPTLRHAAELFAFDRFEQLLLVAPLSQVLADAAAGLAADSRETVRPGASS